MKTSEIFRKAKKLVTYKPDNVHRRYICFGIEDSDISYKDSDRARKIINQRLGRGCNSLEEWLNKKGYAPRHFGLTRAHRIKMQKTRHAWLDSLIKEFEAKGD